MNLFELGAMAIERMEISKCAGPALERPVEQTGETAHLGVLDSSDVVFLCICN